MVAKISLTVVDGFYSNPDRVREIGLSDLRVPYHAPAIQQKLERLIGRRITDFDINRPGVVGNGTFRLSIKGGDPETHCISYVHADTFTREFNTLVYLNPNAPVDAGTSFFRHKETGLYTIPTPSDARRLDVPLFELYHLLIDEAETKSKWEEVDRIGNVYNRALIFRAGRFHSATSCFGKNRKTGRLTQLFVFSTTQINAPARN